MSSQKREGGRERGEANWETEREIRSGIRVRRCPVKIQLETRIRKYSSKLKWENWEKKYVEKWKGVKEVEKENVLEMWSENLK